MKESDEYMLIDIFGFVGLFIVLLKWCLL